MKNENSLAEHLRYLERAYPRVTTQQCWKNQKIRLVCHHCDGEHDVPLRCNLKEMREAKCYGCQSLRRKKIIAKAMDRYDQVMKPTDRLYLWTFGTSLLDEPSNRYLIRKYWRKFIRRLSHLGQPVDPLMNSMEAGTKGDRLHYHVVVRGFMDFDLIQKTWRDITGEKSNVNYAKRGKSPRTAIQAFAYLSKYASKGYSYYWMGSLFRVKETPFEKNSEHAWRFEETIGGVDLLDVKVKTDWISRQTSLFQGVPW